MATLTLAQFTAIADSIGLQYDRLLAANATTAATDVRTGTAANQGRVLTLAADLVEALIPGVNASAVASATVTKAALTLFGDALRALNRGDVLGAAGIDAFLTAQGGRVSRAFADVFALVFTGQVLTPNNIFPPQTTLGAFTLTGAGAGTFSGTGGPIDTARYGAAWCEVETTTAIGAAAIVASLTMLHAGGATTTVHSVTIPAGSASGAKVNIGTSANKYTDVSAITVTGGAAAEAFRVQAKLERVVAL